MKNIEITTIYNVPEAVSGIGFKSHLIGLCLYISLFICAIPCLIIDKTWLHDFINSILDSGLFVTLAMSFIFVLCPIYFFFRFFMELFRTKKAKFIFYSTPNIEYITFNDDNLFFKNTISNNDFSVMKSEIIDIELKGTIKTITSVKKSGTPLRVTFIENLILTIKTKDKDFEIYPDIKIKQVKRQIKDINTTIKMMDYGELIKLQIALYKKHFVNFRAKFKSDNDSKSLLLASELNNYTS